MEHIVIGSNIIVLQEEAISQSEGGIVIPDASKVKPLIGVVAAVPHDYKCAVKAGDRIMFDRFAGTPVELDGKEYLVMNGDDVLIILKGANNARPRK